MTSPYITTGPEDISNLGAQDTLRLAYSNQLSRMFRRTLDPKSPMPTLMGVLLMMTRPYTPQPDQTIIAFDMLMRCPAVIELQASTLLRSDCVLEVQYALVRGNAHTLMALSDNQLSDNMREEGHTLLKLPPNPIGWAFERAAARAGTTCRHWKTSDGTRIWNAINRETTQAEVQMGLTPGLMKRLVAGFEKLTTADVVDIAEIMDEAGCLNDLDQDSNAV